jgi:hypothetical protein
MSELMFYIQLILIAFIIYKIIFGSRICDCCKDRKIILTDDSRGLCYPCYVTHIRLSKIIREIIKEFNESQL